MKKLSLDNVPRTVFSDKNNFDSYDVSDMVSVPTIISFGWLGHCRYRDQAEYE
jgi:hypothetical protein